jgi:hypothetical protein
MALPLAGRTLHEVTALNKDDLAFLPLHLLAPLIASRQVSPVELVEAQLSRIAALDDVLRAYGQAEISLRMVPR